MYPHPPRGNRRHLSTPTPLFYQNLNGFHTSTQTRKLPHLPSDIQKGSLPPIPMNYVGVPWVLCTGGDAPRALKQSQYEEVGPFGHSGGCLLRISGVVNGLRAGQVVRKAPISFSEADADIECGPKPSLCSLRPLIPARLKIMFTVNHEISVAFRNLSTTCGAAAPDLLQPQTPSRKGGQCSGPPSEGPLFPKSLPQFKHEVAVEDFQALKALEAGLVVSE
eukprot:758981-Hanusia_phi.AAC.1